MESEEDDGKDDDGKEDDGNDDDKEDNEARIMTVRLRYTVSFTQKDLVFLRYKKEWISKLTPTQSEYAASTK